MVMERLELSVADPHQDLIDGGRRAIVFDTLALAWTYSTYQLAWPPRMLRNPRLLWSPEVSVPYHSIEDPAKLRRVLEAALLLEADLDLPNLLRHIIDEARSMTNARYGALGVLDVDGTALAEFITVGLEPEEEKAIGARPVGRGVLGLLISEPKPLRLARLGSHPESYGFPPNHPPMTSFLGVPIKVRDAVYGNLYLTDKIGWSEFTSDDEALIGALAVAAGIAIENARLHQRVQEVAVYEERDRLARDLHDTVIQRLFAIGLSLQSMASEPFRAPRVRSESRGRLATSTTPSDRSAPASSNSHRAGSDVDSATMCCPSSKTFDR